MFFSILGPEEVWENKSHDAPDSAGRISIKTTVCEKMTPPSFSMKDQNFIAFSTAAEGPAVHPLQPVTDQVVPAAEGFLKSKTRKPRGPKALWTNTSGIPLLSRNMCVCQICGDLFKTLFPSLFQGAGEAQRKPRVRALKVEKTEAAAKGRKRKKPVKQDMKGSSDSAGAAGPPAGEIDPITATIDAVLANAASIDTSVEKLKKLKRTKKCQETSKRDGEKSAEDDDNEEGSTAGKVSFYVPSQHLIKSNAKNIRFVSHKQVKLKAGGLRPRSRFSSRCNMGNVSFRDYFGSNIITLYWFGRDFWSKMF